jgi:hypothetical protein
MLELNKLQISLYDGAAALLELNKLTISLYDGAAALLEPCLLT